MNCKICTSLAKKKFQAKILNKYFISYFYCQKCKFLQTEEPFWLEEAYKVPINDSDTGILSRNIWFRNISTSIIFFLFNNKNKFLDYAGGYGIFVRMMRDSGFDFYWKDKHTKNFFAKGFEILNNSKKLEMLTCFEAFEHFEKPIQEIENLLDFSRNILFSTELTPKTVPNPNDWWYYGLEHGQHISFYQRETFEFLAKKFNLFFYTNGQNIHMLSQKKLSNLVFRTLVKTSNYISLVIRKKMSSFTWKDFETIRKSKK